MRNSFSFPSIQESPASGKPSYPSFATRLDGARASQHGASPGAATGGVQTRDRHQLRSGAEAELPRATAWSQRTSASAIAPGPMPITPLQTQALMPSSGAVAGLEKAAPARPEKRKAPEPPSHEYHVARQPRQVFTYHPVNMPTDMPTVAHAGDGPMVHTSTWLSGTTSTPPLVYRYEWHKDGAGTVVPLTDRVHEEHAPLARGMMAKPADNGISILGSTIPVAMLLNPPEAPVASPDVSPPVAPRPRRASRQQAARSLPAPMPTPAPSHSNIVQPSVLHTTDPHIISPQAASSPGRPGRPRTRVPRPLARLQPILPAPPVFSSVGVPHREATRSTPRQHAQGNVLPGVVHHPAEPAAASAGPHRYIEIEGNLEDIDCAWQDYLRFTGQRECSQQDFYRGLLKLCLSARHAPARKTAVVEMGSIGGHAPEHYFIELVPGRRIVLIAAIAEVDGAEMFKLAHLLHQPTHRKIRRVSSRMMDAMLLGAR